MEEISLYPWNGFIFNQIEFSESTSSAFGFPFVNNSGPNMTHNLHHKKYNIKHEYRLEFIFFIFFHFFITQEKDPLNYMKQNERPDETIMKGCFVIKKYK